MNKEQDAEMQTAKLCCRHPARPANHICGCGRRRAAPDAGYNLRHVRGAVPERYDFARHKELKTKANKTAPLWSLWLSLRQISATFRP